MDHHGPIGNILKSTMQHLEDTTLLVPVDAGAMCTPARCGNSLGE